MTLACLRTTFTGWVTHNLAAASLVANCLQWPFPATGSQVFWKCLGMDTQWLREKEEVGGQVNDWLFWSTKNQTLTSTPRRFRYSRAPSHPNRRRLSFPCPVLSFPHSLNRHHLEGPFLYSSCTRIPSQPLLPNTRLKAPLLELLPLCNLCSSVSYCWMSNYFTIFPIYWSTLTGIMP